MVTIVVLAIAFGLLFLLAFLTKRRFGVLGLGLCAGALLSEYWTNGASSLLHQQGISIVAPPLESVVAIALTLLPVLILLAGGPSYHKKPERFVGGLLFAGMAFLVLFPILKSIIVIDSAAQMVIDFISLYGTGLLAVLIAAAVIDTMLAHGGRKGGRREH